MAAIVGIGRTVRRIHSKFSSFLDSSLSILKSFVSNPLQKNLPFPIVTRNLIDLNLYYYYYYYKKKKKFSSICNL